MVATQLITALGEFLILESVEDILKQKNNVEETGDLHFTIMNTKEENNKGYKASMLAGAYRAVREVELPKKDAGEKK